MAEPRLEGGEGLVTQAFVGRVSRQGDRKWGGRGALPALLDDDQGSGHAWSRGRRDLQQPLGGLVGSSDDGSCAHWVRGAVPCLVLGGLPWLLSGDGVQVALLGAGACWKTDPHLWFHTDNVLSAVLRAAGLKGAASMRQRA